jgi:hypothetical protein
MIRRFLSYTAFAGLLALGLSTQMQPATAQSQGDQNQQGQQQNQPSTNAKSVAGKVVSVGSDRKSFALEVTGGNTMQFMVDNHTQVTGRVGTGTNAMVQYQTTQDGKNVALVVSPQNQNSQ